MNAGTWVAASGTLTLHVLMLGAALSLVGQQAVREPVRPVEVVLLAPSPPPAPIARAVAEPAPAPEPVRQAVPEPTPPPVEAAKPRPRRTPPPQRAAAAPEPASVVPPPAPKPVVAPIAASVAPAPVVAPIAAPVVVAVAPVTPPAPAQPSAITSAPASPAPRDPAPIAQTMPGPAAAPPRDAPIGEPRAAVATGAATATATRTTPKFDASWVGNAPPPYPTIARRLGEEGEVRLDVHVGPSGRVLDVRLKRSSGSPVLDQTAIETVKKWRFRPATIDGQPVAEWYHDWKWVFKLES